MTEQELQERTKMLVDAEVYVSVGQLVERLMEIDYGVQDDMADATHVKCSACDGNGFPEDDHEDCEDCDGSGYVNAEPLEFWAISRTLYERLKDANEVCLNIHGLWVWGRTTSGQLIYMDEEMRDVVRSMGR
jgi:hypothetical protein